MRHLLNRNERMVVVIAGFCIILVALIWSGHERQLAEDRKETIAAAVQRNSNLAVALEQYAVRTINNADVILQLVKKEFEQSGKNVNIEKLLKDYTVDKSVFTGVAIINAEGNVVAANFPLNSDTVISVKDRMHFKYHQQNADGGLFIGEPVISRTLRKAVIPFTRRLNNADGSFAGTVSIQVEPSTFTGFYREADLHENDIISLVAPDGMTYARRTGSQESFGENISKSPLYQHLKRKSVDNYFAPDAIRNVPTFFSYRKLEQYPIIATVGAAEKDLLANYYKRQSKDRVSAAIIVTLLLLFSILVSVVLLQRKKNIDRIFENEIKYRTIFENSLDAILLMQPDGKMLAANPAACGYFKMTEKEIGNSNLAFLADITDSNYERLRKEERVNGSVKGQMQFLRSDGSRFVGEMASALHRDAAGNERSIMIIRDITERLQMEEQLYTQQKRYQRRVTEQVILAQEREREEIGRELHDNVNQVLTTVKLYLEMAITHKHTREELLPKSVEYVMKSINEIRNLSRDLSAPTLGTKSLIDSIAALLEMVQSSSGLQIQFNHDHYRHNLQMDQQLAIYRILQEQLNNVIKHAKATQVAVSLFQTENETKLTIEDDGRGFDTMANRNGIGLNNIVSRAKIFEGDVRITSSTGKGCLMEVTMPISSNDEESISQNESSGIHL